MLKYNFNKRVKGVMMAAVLLVILIAGAIFPNRVSAAVYGYETRSYNVEIDVQEDNSFLVTETIDVDFHTEKHGVFRYIPLEGDAYYKVNGDPVKQTRKMKIDQVNVEGYDYETSHENGNYVIKIGDPDEVVTGRQKYKISYRCRAYDDKIDAYDMFYYNVLPNSWETPINRAQIEIRMPKPFDSDSLDVYAGAYGTNDDADKFSIKVTDNTIQIQANRPLPRGVGVTVQEMLPEGYFVNEMNTDWAYPLLIGIALFSALIALLLWFCFGRDPQMVRPVEFYPPDHLTSADMGYIIDGYADRKDLISMIIYFADQGYITIEETEGKEFILHKVTELPASAQDFEVTLMSGLFACGNGDSVKLSELKDEFYSSYQAAVDQLKSKYKKKEYRLFHKSGNAARVAAAILMIVPVAAGIALSSIFAQEDMLAIAAIPISIILFILYLIGMLLYDKKETMLKGKFTAVNVVIFALSVLLLLGTLVLIFFLAGLTAGIAVAVSSIVGYFCARQMRKRTPYGNAITGRILGFKHFIQTAELEKLKLLVDENPAYFYNILPYAYVFGLSDKWSKKFESIAVEPPSWYGGYYGSPVFSTWVFMNAFHSCTNQIQQNITIPSASEGGGISTGSGFGGGGGFSGGGFGGGGGGSW